MRSRDGLLRSGWLLMIASTSDGRLAPSGGPPVATAVADVADDGQIEACFAELGKHWDGFDILVHCIAYAPREAIGGDFLDGISRENFAIAQDIGGQIKVTEDKA